MGEVDIQEQAEAEAVTVQQVALVMRQEQAGVADILLVLGQVLEVRVEPLVQQDLLVHRMAQLLSPLYF